MPSIDPVYVIWLGSAGGAALVTYALMPAIRAGGAKLVSAILPAGRVDNRLADNRLDVAEALCILRDHCEGLDCEEGRQACDVLAPLVFQREA